MAYMHRVDEYPSNAASPTDQPGCFTCGSPKRTTGPEAKRPGGEYLFDLGVQTDEVRELSGFTHAFKVCVLCESCVLELAALAGCLPPDRSDQLLQANISMSARLQEYDEQAAQWDKLRDQINKVNV